MPTKSNPFVEALHAIRDELKDYAVVQRALKAARKIPLEDITPELREELELGEWGQPVYRVISNRGRITALLNFYLAARGREYRHNVRPQSEGVYIAEMRHLHKKFPTLAQAADATDASLKEAV